MARSGNGRYTKNSCAAIFPDKMLRPGLLARMIKGDSLPCRRVYTCDTRTLKLVTEAASKAKVFIFRYATLAFGNNMVWNHSLTGVELSGLAIGAAVIIGCF